MLLSIVIGTLVGVVAGYRGGWIGAVLMRTVDGFLSFPSIFLVLALAAAFRPSPVMITVIIARHQVDGGCPNRRGGGSLAARARVCPGRSDAWAKRHAYHVPGDPAQRHGSDHRSRQSLTVARAILLEAYISFLGYGIQPPLPSWGNMLNGAQQYLASAPWLAIIPGAAITIAVTSFNFIGDGLRDALDVRDEHI